MPFGLCNATATFQRMMAKAFKGIEQREGSLVMCYVDDVIIATDSIEEHMLRLREVFVFFTESRTEVQVFKVFVFTQ